MFAAGNNNVNDNDTETIIFTVRDITLSVPVVTLSARENQKSSKLVSKECENKITKNKYRYFFESNFAGVDRLFVLIYLNIKIDVKEFDAWKYYLRKGIIDNYNAISVEKTFMTKQLIQV